MTTRKQLKITEEKKNVEMQLRSFKFLYEMSLTKLQKRKWLRNRRYEDLLFAIEFSCFTLCYSSQLLA